MAIAFGLSQQFLPQAGRGDARFDVRWVAGLIALALVIAVVSGIASWYFTRFVIDDEELRIETGVVVKRSKKIPFERLQSVDIVQPLLARVLGLAELRLEAGAGDSATTLRYLKRAKATRLRDYLLARAQGYQTTLGAHDTRPLPSPLTDQSVGDRILVRVPPTRLVASFLLSTEWMLAVLGTIAVVVATTVAGIPVAALGGIIPLAIGAVRLIGDRLIGMFNFTLAESSRGLRITRGLTNLTSQSVPLDRVQGVKTVQPLLWRPLGWMRAELDILGYGRGGDDNNESVATSVLLPVATTDEVTMALSRVLPQVGVDAIDLHPAPRRARWLRWFDFWTLRYGWDDRALVTTHGWLNHVRDIVPHAKTQSVRIEQGPLQRRLGLADVQIHTPKGPVNAVARQIDAGVARELALSQLDRARAARATERDDRASRRNRRQALEDDDLLAAFGTDRSALLGSGGECEVFALGAQHVLRLYRPSEEAAVVAPQLAALYGGWRETPLPFALPLTVETGRRAGRTYAVDVRLPGENLSHWLGRATTEDRRTALRSFLDATLQLQRLPSPLHGFARLIGPHAGRRFDTLTALLDDMLAGPLTRSRSRLEADLPDLGRSWTNLHRDLAGRTVQPTVVHGDICPPNAYVAEVVGRPVISAIGDFSPHTVHGDPLLDVTGAVAFLELERYPGATDDAAWLTDVAADLLGPEVRHWIEVYRRFYGLYFSDTYDVDPGLYAWCLDQLSD